MDDTAVFEAFAKLRIGMPRDALARIVGEERMPRRDTDKGYFFYHVHEPGALGPKIPFIARIATDQTIASLTYAGNFKGTVDALDLSIGTPVTDLFAREPSWQRDDAESSEKHQIEAWRRDLSDGVVTVVKVRDGSILAVSMERVGATYPGELSPEAKLVRKNMRSYDMEMLHRFVDKADNQGWVFGLPPGIKPEQWPLDPISGYPLMHGFTLLLPEDYRVHGPDIVAISFFATAADQNDGGAEKRDDLYAAVVGAPAAGTEGADLSAFRKHAATAHPRLHRMRDILDYAYAVILLTQEEFDGPPCRPPEFAANSYLDDRSRPRWMSEGSGHACFWGTGGSGMDGMPVFDGYIHKILGEVPAKRLDWHRAIQCTPRANDPNAGIPPRDVYGDPEAGGYQPHFYFEGGKTDAEHYREHDWAKDHKRDHIGGTMRPTQATPEFSPFYVEFGEEFGGYNFGAGGNAQLDFLEMKFDWACG